MKLRVPRREGMLLAAVGILTLATGLMDGFGAPHVLTFVVATFALAGVAYVITIGTDELSGHVSPAMTGVLQATLGNLPELFVAFFALKAHELVVAQTSVIGSIFANALLALGVVIILGARASDDGVMRFHQRLPRDTSTLLLLATFLIALLGLSRSLHNEAGRHAEVISVVGAITLLAVYGLWLPRYLRDAREAHVQEEHPPSGQSMSLPMVIIVLALAGVAAALVSDWFISALKPSLKTLHLSETFAGLVIAAIAGNAVEHSAALVQAHKGNNDLAMAVVMNSVSQVMMFLFPVLVLISLPLATSLTFVVHPVFIGALALMSLSLWQISGDGQAYQFEGSALVALYVILALIAFYS